MIFSTDLAAGHDMYNHTGARHAEYQYVVTQLQGMSGINVRHRTYGKTSGLLRQDYNRTWQLEYGMLTLQLDVRDETKL